jgi:hypothetical protein
MLRCPRAAIAPNNSAARPHRLRDSAPPRPAHACTPRVGTVKCVCLQHGASLGLGLAAMATCNGTAAVTRARAAVAVTRARAAVASHVAASHVAIVARCNRRMLQRRLLQRRLIQRRMVPASIRFGGLGVALRLTPGSPHRRGDLRGLARRRLHGLGRRRRGRRFTRRTAPHDATQCITMQHNASLCNMTQHDAAPTSCTRHTVQRRARYCDHMWRRPSRSASRRNVCATCDVASHENALHRHRNGIYGRCDGARYRHCTGLGLYI